jgi:hypothetical protein
VDNYNPPSAGFFMGENKMNEQIGIPRMFGQSVAVPQTTRESIINRLHAINARTVNLSKKMEVLDPILRNGLGAQDSKQVSEPERKLPPLYDEIKHIADSLEYSLRVIEDTLDRVEL